jgi:hypothetical protein
LLNFSSLDWKCKNILKNKKPASHLWAETQEETASIQPDKDGVNLNYSDNLIMVDNQHGSPCNSATSQRHWVLKHLLENETLNTFIPYHNLVITRSSVRMKEHRIAEYLIRTSWPIVVTSEGIPCRMVRETYDKSLRLWRVI